VRGEAAPSPLDSHSRLPGLPHAARYHHRLRRGPPPRPPPGPQPTRGGQRRAAHPLLRAEGPGRGAPPPRLADRLPGQPTPPGMRPGAAAGQLRAVGAAGRGRHGPGLQGPQLEARPHRRPESHPQGTSGQRGRRPPLLPRDPGGCAAVSPQHRAGLRRRRGRQPGSERGAALCLRPGETHTGARRPPWLLPGRSPMATARWRSRSAGSASSASPDRRGP
jgi:hypothetical protein